MKLRLTDVLSPGPNEALRLATLGAMSVAGFQEAEPHLRSLSERSPLPWLAFAERNRVGPIVAHELVQRIGGPPDAPWRSVHDQSRARMDALLDTLDEVAERLSRDGIRLVALKNGGIARGLYPCRACCPMGDVDVLIERERFRDAHHLLIGMGFALDTRSSVEAANIEAGLVQGGLEYVKRVGDHEVWLELQWRPIAGRWIRADQEPDAGQLLADSVPIEGSAARLLAPTDNLLQVALHTAKHSFVRAPGLRLHTDVDRLVAYAPPDWTRLVDAASRLQVRTPVYFSLALAAALLATPVPTRVLAAMAPPGWKVRVVSRWIRRCDVFEPDERKFTRPEMMAFHALLYDDLTGLVASALDSEPGELRLRNLPRHVRRGVARMIDLALRYQD